MKRAWVRNAMSLAMAGVLFGLSGCGGSDGSSFASAGAPAPTPGPGTPTAAPPPPPDPGTYSVTVTWSMPSLNTDGTPLTDVSGYFIHYGTSPGNLAQSVLMAGAGVTSGVVNGLMPGTYYFAVTTINSAGTASTPSNPASVTVP
jgi:hypothetical protein